MEPEKILYALILTVITIAISYWAGRARDKSNEEDKTLTGAVTRLEKLEATAVNESRVREIIKDAIEPTGTDVKEVKQAVKELSVLMHDIQLKLVTEMAFKRGAKQRDE